VSVVRYSLIQLNDLEQCPVKGCAWFDTTTQDSNSGVISEEFQAPGTVPLRYDKIMRSKT